MKKIVLFFIIVSGLFCCANAQKKDISNKNICADAQKKQKKSIGEKYITNKREFVNYREGNVCNIKLARKNDAYLKGKEYLTTMVMLSKCDCILASVVSGTVGMAVFSDGWSYEHFYDLGRY